MKKIIQTYLATLVLILSFTSCLDLYPEDAILEEDAITDVSTVGQVVNGIYSTFKSSALYSGHLTLLPDIQCDFVQAIEGSTGAYSNIWRWETLPTDKDVTAVYGDLYRVIGRCNFALEGIEKIKETTFGESKTKLEGYIGEIHFARALAYSELIKLFCKDYEKGTAANTLGVVLVDSYSDAGVLKRASLEASYAYVLADLAKASEALNKVYDADARVYNSIYFTPYVVDALYARVYLYMDNAEKAIEHATKVIDSKKFFLSSVNQNFQTGSSINDYQYMWMTDNATEIIWKVGFKGPNSFGGRLGEVFLSYSPGSGYKPSYVPSQNILDLYTNGDKRYEANFATLQTAHSHQLSWPLLVKYYGNRSFIQEYNRFHTCMPKVFRLPEQYLIRAEAYAMQGRYSLASNDLITLQKARYTGSFLGKSVNADNWLDVISEERTKELYMEGFRLNDLKRWKKGFTRKEQAHSLKPGDELNISASNPLFVWPIPQHELDIPGGQIEPNESNM